MHIYFYQLMKEPNAKRGRLGLCNSEKNPNKYNTVFSYILLLTLDDGVLCVIPNLITAE